MKLTTVSHTIFRPFSAVSPQSDLLQAAVAWWERTPAAYSLTSDGRLWELEAAEDVALPYATVALSSEDVDTWTTGFALYRARLEIRLHAQTAASARGLAKSLRLAFKGAPLVVSGQAVLHVLPDGDSFEIGKGVAPGGRDCWVGVEAFDVPWPQLRPVVASDGPFDGADVLAAIQTWFQGAGAASSLTADGRLWYAEAPETTPLPYATYFLVAEPVDTQTTGFALYRTSVQINLHASTADAARTAGLGLRTALTLAPLTVARQAVCHVLPDGDSIQLGEGLAPGGQDCWVAIETFEIPWTE